MDNEQQEKVLKAAIRQAIAGGWKGWSYPTSEDLLTHRWESKDRVFSDGEFDTYNTLNVETVLFNHGFAIGLWGEDLVRNHDNGEYEVEWQYHLQQMVLAEDPIEYLRKFTYTSQET